MSGETPESGEGPAPTGPPTTVQDPPSGTDDGAPHASGHVHAHHPTIQLRFLEQLKHRNIIRVGILYLVACWLILDPVHVVFHMLEVPAWANRLVVILMAIGFPAVLLFAWVYEITPEGLKPTVEVDPHRSIRKLTGQRLDRAIMVVLVLGIAYLLVDKFWLSKHVAAVENETTTSALATTPPAAVMNEKSIAVLPFTDMSEKKDQEYFSDGMAEEIIDLLSKVPDLHVPARTSSFYFKGKPEDIPTIARRLMVAHVLEGSVRKSGNHLRITAQLVRADTGYHVWSETFDRELDDVFKVQDEIAGAVVKALKVSLIEGETPRATPTTNTEAYTLYLQARTIAGRAAEVDSGAAVNYLQQAVTLDPNFAAAWAAIASILVDEFSWHRSRPYQEVRAEAHKAAEQALKLDPKLSDGHLAMAKILHRLDWDWNAAEAEYKRALELDPGNADAMRWKSYLALELHRVDQALQLAQRAVSHDPLNSWNFHAVAIPLSAIGRFREAEAVYRTALALNPTGAGLHAFLGDVLRARGEPAAALAETERETDDLWRQSFLPFALEALGRKSDADNELANLEKKYAAQAPASIAEFYACREDADRAIAWLDRAFRQRDFDPISNRGSCFKNLEPDPRYKALLRKRNLPE